MVSTGDRRSIASVASAVGIIGPEQVGVPNYNFSVVEILPNPLMNRHERGLSIWSAASTKETVAIDAAANAVRLKSNL